MCVPVDLSPVLNEWSRTYKYADYPQNGLLGPAPRLAREWKWWMNEWRMKNEWMMYEEWWWMSSTWMKMNEWSRTKKWMICMEWISNHWPGRPSKSLAKGYPLNWWGVKLLHVERPPTRTRAWMISIILHVLITVLHGPGWTLTARNRFMDMACDKDHCVRCYNRLHHEFGGCGYENELMLDATWWKWNEKIQSKRCMNAWCYENVWWEWNETMNENDYEINAGCHTWWKWNAWWEWKWLWNWCWMTTHDENEMQRWVKMIMKFMPDDRTWEAYDHRIQTERHQAKWVAPNVRCAEPNESV